MKSFNLEMVTNSIRKKKIEWRAKINTSGSEWSLQIMYVCDLWALTMTRDCKPGTDGKDSPSSTT